MQMMVIGQGNKAPIQIMKNLINIYDLVYYRLFRIVDAFSDGAISHISAAVLWAVVQMSFGYLALTIGLYFGFIKKGEGDPYGALIAYLIGVGICLLNIYAIAKNDRYKKILKKYSNQRPSIASVSVDMALVVLVVAMAIFAFLADQK